MGNGPMPAISVKKGCPSLCTNHGGKPVLLHVCSYILHICVVVHIYVVVCTICIYTHIQKKKRNTDFFAITCFSVDFFQRDTDNSLINVILKIIYMPVPLIQS